MKYIKDAVIMNKLKELAKKADCTLDGMGYGEGNVEGFAKLIVKECAEFTDPGMKPFLFKHFRVEE